MGSSFQLSLAVLHLGIILPTPVAEVDVMNAMFLTVIAVAHGFLCIAEILPLIKKEIDQHSPPSMLA